MTAASAERELTAAAAFATTLAARVSAGARFAGLFGTAIPASPSMPAGAGLAYRTSPELGGNGALLLSAHLAAGGELETVEAVVPAGMTAYPAVTPLVGAALPVMEV